MPPTKESTALLAANKRKEAAREVIDTLHEMAILLVRPTFSGRMIMVLTQNQNTHLTRTQLSYCVSLIENGVNPEALAVSAFSSMIIQFLTMTGCDPRA